jgi:hypothetical protein
MGEVALNGNRQACRNGVATARLCHDILRETWGNHRLILTLAEAIKSGRLSEFIAKQEDAALPAADPAAFDRLIRAAVKPAKSAGRTSRSELPAVRPIAELGEVSGHPLLGDMNVR